LPHKGTRAILSDKQDILIWFFGNTDMRYTLRQLEVFLAVARDESVSRAATALAMSQSAVSGSLADLEGQFDVQLFDRVGKRLRLSALGRSVRPGAEAALDQALAFERDLANRRDAARLRIGATLTIGNHVAVPLMAQFMSEHPGAELTLAIANTEEIARQVVNFEIDVGLIEGELEHIDLDVTPWREDQLVVFCAPSHPLARKRALTDDDLRAAAWIVRERGSGTRQTFDRAMRGLHGELRIALELQHTEAIKSAVEAGLGIGCVSPIALQDAMTTSKVKICKVPHRDFRRKFFFLVHKQKHRGAGIQRWLELCRQSGTAAASGDA
jgi:DNA-binding transcriptional LysR family regulator